MKKPPAKADSPETNFPISLSDRVTVLGNYFINLFLVTGDKATALFETGISGITEFTLYTKENIANCNQLLVKRARQFAA